MRGDLPAERVRRARPGAPRGHRAGGGDALLRAHAATAGLRAAPGTPPDPTAPAPPLISRDPVTSVMQSIFEEKLEDRFGDAIEAADPEDPAWVCAG